MTTLAQLEPKLNRAFELTVLEFAALLTREISDPKWEWPTGESPRDIVDTGRLRNSQEIIYIGFLRGEIRYPVSYAEYVRTGYVIESPSGARVVFPGRDWVASAMAQFNWTARFKANLAVA